MNDTNKARIFGAANVAFGGLILFLSWLIPSMVSHFVAQCNTVLGDMANRQDGVLGAKCAAANFVTDYRVFFVIIGLADLFYGLYVLFGANNTAVREELGIED